MALRQQQQQAVNDALEDQGQHQQQAEGEEVRYGALMSQLGCAAD